MEAHSQLLRQNVIAGTGIIDNGEAKWGDRDWDAPVALL